MTTMTKNETRKMAALNPILSIITLNVNGLKISITRQRLSDWIKKQDANFELTRATLNRVTVG